jgi:hypothetical protein
MAHRIKMTVSPSIDMNESIANATYEGDFYAWLLKSAGLLRRGQFVDLNLEQYW